MEKELMTHVPMVALIEQYESIMAKINVIFDNIESMVQEIRIAVNDEYYGIDFHLRQASRETQICKTRKVFWKYACEKLQLYNLMSQEKRKEFDKQLNDDALPEFTAENVHSTFQRLIDNIGSILEETIFEAFEICRPHHSGYKTNTEYAVKKRIILEWMIDTYVYRGKRNHPSLDHGNEQKLRILDNAFSLMDGKGPVKYPGDSITTLKEALSSRQQECETAYFKYRWHLNGTLHVTFKRMDLVKTMNEVGGKGLLNKEAA